MEIVTTVEIAVTNLRHEITALRAMQAEVVARAAMAEHEITQLAQETSLFGHVECFASESPEDMSHQMSVEGRQAREEHLTDLAEIDKR